MLPTPRDGGGFVAGGGGGGEEASTDLEEEEKELAREVELNRDREQIARVCAGLELLFAERAAARGKPSHTPSASDGGDDDDRHDAGRREGEDDEHAGARHGLARPTPPELRIQRNVVAWDSAIEQATRATAEKAALYKVMHTKAAEALRRKQRHLTYANMVAAPVAAVFTAFGVQFPSLNASFSIVATTLLMIVGILSSMLKFQKYEQRAQQHRTAASNYIALESHVRVQLTLSRKHRNASGLVFRFITGNYSGLLRTSPTLPHDIVTRETRRARELGLAVPEEFDVNALTPVFVNQRGVVPSSLSSPLPSASSSASSTSSSSAAVEVVVTAPPSSDPQPPPPRPPPPLISARLGPPPSLAAIVHGGSEIAAIASDDGGADQTELHRMAEQRHAHLAYQFEQADLNFVYV